MIQIGFKMLAYDRAKEIAMIMAIALAAFLMQNQGSMMKAFLGMSGSQIRDVAEVDFWVMEPDTECFDQAKPLPDKALHVVRGVNGVLWAVPLLKFDTHARTEEGRLRTITIIGVDPSNGVGLPRMRSGDAREIYAKDSACIDPGGWQILFPGQDFQPGKRIRIQDRWLTLTGLSDASAPFTGFPVIHSALSTVREMNRAEARSTTFVVGRSRPGLRPEEVALRIEAGTPWRAYSSLDFERASYRFYESQGVPMIFYITITIGLLVGVAFTAQTFLMFVKENARSLITMKVMGVSNRQLALMMGVQAGYLSFLGLSFGTVGAVMAAALIRQVPMLRAIYIPAPVVIVCAVLMVGIALTAAAFAFRRVLKLQPAEVFRS